MLVLDAAPSSFGSLPKKFLVIMADTALLRYAEHLIYHLPKLISPASFQFIPCDVLFSNLVFLVSLWALDKAVKVRFDSFMNQKGRCHFLFFHSLLVSNSPFITAPYLSHPCLSVHVNACVFFSELKYS